MDPRPNLEGALPSIRRYIERVGREMPIAAVYLFGSYARGEARENSDIDLAIVSPSLGPSRIENNARLGMMTWEVDTRIEPLGYRPEDFNESRMMPSQILKTGIMLYPEDRSSRVQI